MFGMQDKETARRFKDSEPKVDDVKVNVDDMAPVGTEELKAKAKKKQTFGEAFKAARARPTGSGSTFTWNGKKYNFSTKEEEAMRPGGSFPESKKNTPGGRSPMSRSSTVPASKKPDSPVTKAASTPTPPRASSAAPTTGGYMTRGGGSAPSGASGLGFFKDKRDDYFAKMKAYRESKGIKEPAKPDLLKNPGIKFRTAESINADRASEASRNAASDKARSDRQKAADDSFGARVSADLEKYKYGKPGMKSGGSCGSSMKKYAKGGSVGYSKMEMEHVAQMKKHGVPEKYVKEEEKEAKGMKKGGMTSCYAKGGGVEAKGRGAGKMVRMASGGSVSSRADGIASRGRTRGKVC